MTVTGDAADPDDGQEAGWGGLGGVDGDAAAGGDLDRSAKFSWIWTRKVSTTVPHTSTDSRPTILLWTVNAVLVARSTPACVISESVPSVTKSLT